VLSTGFKSLTAAPPRVVPLAEESRAAVDQTGVLFAAEVQSLRGVEG
jgi:hypothetical protein